jgi:hypothetical protein
VRLLIRTAPQLYPPVTSLHHAVLGHPRTVPQLRHAAHSSARTAPQLHRAAHSLLRAVTSMHRTVPWSHRTVPLLHRTVPRLHRTEQSFHRIRRTLLPSEEIEAFPGLAKAGVRQAARGQDATRVVQFPGIHTLFSEEAGHAAQVRAGAGRAPGDAGIPG